MFGQDFLIHSTMASGHLLTKNIDSNEEVNFVGDSVAAQSFSEYLADTDTDEDNPDLGT